MNRQLFKDVDRLPDRLGSLYVEDFSGGKYTVAGLVRYTPPESISDLFQVSIKIPSGYPYVEPVLFETGGRYPFRDERHINFDGSCCVEVPAVVEHAARNGLSLSRYVDRFVVPFFANQIYYDETGRFLTERSHGVSGIREHIRSIANVSDSNELKTVLRYCLKNRNLGRNDQCFCGSERKYKHCHLQQVEILTSYYSRETLAFHLPGL